jgi:hypothetical protein
MPNKVLPCPQSLLPSVRDYRKSVPVDHSRGLDAADYGIIANLRNLLQRSSRPGGLSESAKARIAAVAVGSCHFILRA